MAMQSPAKLWSLIAFFFLVLAVLLLAERHFPEAPSYPAAEMVFSRRYDNIQRFFQLSVDPYEKIIAWYDGKLIGITQEKTKSPQEANIPCTERKWQQDNAGFVVTLCNYPEHRTISTQIVLP